MFTLEEFEASFDRKRLLGRGRFAAAVLYGARVDGPKLDAPAMDGAATSTAVVVKEVALESLTEREKEHTANEAKILSSLRHDNIVRCYGSFVDPSKMLLSILLEYADGGTLAERVKSHVDAAKPIGERTVLRWMQQTASAVECVHSANVLHRDIKSANIFLTRDGAVKLGDFGVSRQLSETAPMANTVCGTPYYLAPELINGDSYSKPADMWALGCVLYEVVTLTRPFAGKSIGELVLNITAGRYDSVDGTDLGLSECTRAQPQIARLVKSLLRLDPSARATAASFLAEATATAAELNSLATPPTPTTSIKEPSSSVSIAADGALLFSAEGRRPRAAIQPVIVEHATFGAESHAQPAPATTQRIGDEPLLHQGLGASHDRLTSPHSDCSSASSTVIDLRLPNGEQRTSPPPPPMLAATKARSHHSSSDLVLFRDTVSETARRERRRRGAARSPAVHASHPGLVRHQSMSGVPASVHRSPRQGGAGRSPLAPPEEEAPPPSCLHPSRVHSVPANLGWVQLAGGFTAQPQPRRQAPMSAVRASFYNGVSEPEDQLPVL